MNRTFINFGLGLTLLLLSSTAAPTLAGEQPQSIKIVARRYEFSPSTIVLKKGTPVVLQISTEDRSHGFYAPDLNLRADIMPGKVTELNITPKKKGDFDFFCDIFCGSGHESMMGKIKVVE